MIKEEYKHSDITQKIIGCAFLVSNKLKPGYPESVFQRALEIELNKIDLKINREITKPIYYDSQIIGHRRLDFVVNDTVLIELKAISALDSGHAAQILNYLEIFEIEIGLLINFGSQKIEIKRFTNNKLNR